MEYVNLEISEKTLDKELLKLIGKKLNNADLHQMLEDRGHYVQSNPNRSSRNSDVAYAAHIKGERFALGSGHLIAMKKAFFIASKANKT